MTLATDGSEDDEIRISGLENYRVGKQLEEGFTEETQFTLIGCDEIDYEESLVDQEEREILSSGTQPDRHPSLLRL